MYNEWLAVEFASNSATEGCVSKEWFWRTVSVPRMKRHNGVASDCATSGSFTIAHAQESLLQMSEQAKNDGCMEVQRLQFAQRRDPAGKSWRVGLAPALHWQTEFANFPTQQSAIKERARFQSLPELDPYRTLRSECCAT